MKISIIFCFVALTCATLTSSARPPTRQHKSLENHINPVNRKQKGPVAYKFSQPVRREPYPARKHVVIKSGRKAGPRKFKKPFKSFFPQIRHQRISKGNYKFISSKPNFPDNRRKIAETNFSPLVYKRAEDIAGYQKFTLDEVIYPDKANARSDNVKESEEETETLRSTNLPLKESTTSR